MTFSHHGTHCLRRCSFSFFLFFCHFRGFKAPKWSGEKGGSETEAAIESKEGGKSKRSVAAF